MAALGGTGGGEDGGRAKVWREGVRVDTRRPRALGVEEEERGSVGTAELSTH